MRNKQDSRFTKCRVNSIGAHALIVYRGSLWGSESVLCFFELEVGVM